MPKQPAVKAPPEVRKQPVHEVPDPDEVVKHEPLSWGFRFLDLGGDWGWRALDPAEAAELHKRLTEDIEGKHLFDLLRSRLIKRIPVEHLTLKARRRLNSTDLEEAEELYEIRLGWGKRRVWGLMEKAVFCSLWWDPLETACVPPQGRSSGSSDLRRQACFAAAHPLTHSRVRSRELLPIGTYLPCGLQT